MEMGCKDVVKLVRQLPAVQCFFFVRLFQIQPYFLGKICVVVMVTLQSFLKFQSTKSHNIFSQHLFSLQHLLRFVRIQTHWTGFKKKKTSRYVKSNKISKVCLAVVAKLLLDNYCLVEGLSKWSKMLNGHFLHKHQHGGLKVFLYTFTHTQSGACCCHTILPKPLHKCTNTHTEPQLNTPLLSC